MGCQTFFFSLFVYKNYCTLKHTVVTLIRLHVLQDSNVLQEEICGDDGTRDGVNGEHTE